MSCPSQKCLFLGLLMSPSELFSFVVLITLIICDSVFALAVLLRSMMAARASPKPRFDRGYVASSLVLTADMCVPRAATNVRTSLWEFRHWKAAQFLSHYAHLNNLLSHLWLWLSDPHQPPGERVSYPKPQPPPAAGDQPFVRCEVLLG